jgi:hypothetical protein
VVGVSPAQAWVDGWLVLLVGPLVAGVASLAWAGPDVRPWGSAGLDDAGFVRWSGFVLASVPASFLVVFATFLGIPVTAVLLGVAGGETGADGLPGLVTAAFAVGFFAGFLLDQGRSLPAAQVSGGASAHGGAASPSRSRRPATALRALP